MGGKSTLLRQTCLAALLAHVGAWVPAEALCLSPVDALFVRMGGAPPTGPVPRSKARRHACCGAPLSATLHDSAAVGYACVRCPFGQEGTSLHHSLTHSVSKLAARDNIFGGQSTFLLELSETAALLNSATRRSLVRRRCHRYPGCSQF